MKQTDSNRPKVSVIIPVYNTEAYVRQTIESICSQTLDDLEVIVVNDGSTDGSLSVLEEMAAADPRIRLLSQNNSGISLSRNRGVEQAKAPYLYFMDSDDVLEPDALESCYTICKEKELDFLFFDAAILNPESSRVMGMSYDRSRCVEEGKVDSGIHLLKRQLETHCYSPSPCLNFIDIHFYKKHHFRFFPGIVHEDQLSTARLYLSAERVMYLNRKFFLRRFREDSIMTKPFSWKNVEGYLAVTEELIKDRCAPDRATVVDLLLSQMLVAVAEWNAYTLPLKERIRLFSILRKHPYTRYIPLRSAAKMLLKKFLK